MPTDIETRLLQGMESQLNQLARRIERQSEINLEQLQRQWMRFAERQLQKLVEQMTLQALQGNPTEAATPAGDLFSGLSGLWGGDNAQPASRQDQAAGLAAGLHSLQRNR